MPFDRDEFYREVGLRLQLTRKRKGLTQEDVAEQLGIPRATYANVESGRQRVSLDVVWKIAAVFGVSIDNLVPEPIAADESPKRQSLAPESGTAWLGITVKQ